MNQRSDQPRRVLITAGPTHEPIDSVRYLANRSTGRMGAALAEAAASRGWATTLLLGPVPRPPHFSTPVQVMRFHSTADLQQLLTVQWPQHDVLIMAAAVADYRPAGGPAPGKIARRDGTIVLELESTPDLLAEAASRSRPGQVLIGFALAPGDEVADSARRKLREKAVHAIVANPIETMESDRISGEVYMADGQRVSPGEALSKADFAGWLMDRIAMLAGSERNSG